MLKPFVIFTVGFFSATAFIKIIEHNEEERLRAWSEKKDVWEKQRVTPEQKVVETPQEKLIEESSEAELRYLLAKNDVFKTEVLKLRQEIKKLMDAEKKRIAEEKEENKRLNEIESTRREIPLKDYDYVPKKLSDLIKSRKLNGTKLTQKILLSAYAPGLVRNITSFIFDDGSFLLNTFPIGSFIHDSQTNKSYFVSQGSIPIGEIYEIEGIEKTSPNAIINRGSLPCEPPYKSKTCQSYKQTTSFKTDAFGKPLAVNARYEASVMPWTQLFPDKKFQINLKKRFLSTLKNKSVFFHGATQRGKYFENDVLVSEIKLVSIEKVKEHNFPGEELSDSLVVANCRVLQISGCKPNVK